MLITKKSKIDHPILTFLIVICGLFYIFFTQLNLPFSSDAFLYGIVMCLLVMTVLTGRIVISKQILLFLCMTAASALGFFYTIRPSEGLREAILWIFFFGVFLLSAHQGNLIQMLVKWIYLVSIFLVLTSILHMIVPTPFNLYMQRILRPGAYDQLMWSYSVDNAYAGIAAYTPNTTFSAAIVFGHSFMVLLNKSEMPIIRGRLANFLLLVLSVYSTILCSKRGIFVAVIIASVILLCFLYRGINFISKFLGITAACVFALVVLYYTNDFVQSFLNRFVSDDFTTGRDEIYTAVLGSFFDGNIFIGRGTGATYAVAETGAHNIYIQILHDHGFVLSIPYYAFLGYNYFLAFKHKCAISIYMQTIFLVYGLTGNPMYSNMFMLIYLYYVLYANRMPTDSHRRMNVGKTLIRKY